MLHQLQANPSRWQRFVAHVTQVFPAITTVTTPPAPNGNKQLTICIWQVDVELQREDLAIRLSDCGTGVGQVLAILYVAMTRKDSVVVIDELNSFLHPGAAKKLIEILKQYRDNQYVISTHSADLIGAIEPEVIHQICWNSDLGQSIVDQVDRDNLDQMADIMADLGIRLSDVFGADQVIWVEGQTETSCFPISAHHASIPVPVGTLFVRVRATGDFDAKRTDAKQVWDIYRQLTNGAALMPPAIGFSFDREGRTDRQMDDLKRESGDRISFLPRRLLENYFLHVYALANAISKEFVLRDIGQQPPTAEELTAKIKSIAENDPGRNNDLDWWKDDDWIHIFNGAHLLSELFDSYGLTYSKIRHGEEITRWLIDNDPSHIDELQQYLQSLWAKG